MSASAKLRRTYVADLYGYCTLLSLTASTPFNDALKLTVSDLKALLSSEVYKKHLEQKGFEIKLITTIIDGINAVIKSIGTLCKTMARR